LQSGDVLFASVVSSLCVALAATGLGALSAVPAGGGSGRSGRFRRALPLLLCWGLPALAVGYGLSPIASKLTGRHVAIGVLYHVVVVCRLAALAGLAFLFLPEPLGPEARHTFSIAPAGGEGGGWLAALPRKARFLIVSGGGVRAASVFLLVFLFAFGEFELASMLNFRRWTTVAFEACSQGRSAVDVAKTYAVPCLIQFCAAVAFLSIVPKNGGGRGVFSLDEKGNVGRGRGASVRFLSWLTAWGVFAVVAGFPCFVIGKGAVKGISVVLKSPWMLSETTASFLFALAAVACAWGIAKAVSTLGRGRVAAAAAVLPGLLGALPVSLALLSIFQTPSLAALRDTPAPLVLALTLLSAPYAVAAVFLGESFADGESLHSARLAGELDGKGRWLLRWSLKSQPMAVMMALVFVFAYFELTASTILAPSATPTVSTRLFNLAHYGESERLSATLFLVSLPPMALLALAAAPWSASRRRFFSPSFRCLRHPFGRCGKT